MDKLEDIHGHEVKIYASDTGHEVESAPVESTGATKGRLAQVGERCRHQVEQRPLMALVVASLAGGALGAVAGFYARGRR